jgi:ABC-2 type transport system permease protein
MYKHLSAVRKECLILLRDKAGLAMLFIMPMALIIISSLMQEFAWNSIGKEASVQILFVNNDKDSLGYNIEKGLRNSGSFEVIDSLNNRPVTQDVAKAAVVKGDYLIAIIIPEGTTKAIRTNVRVMVAKTLSGFGMINTSMVQNLSGVDSVNISIYFDVTVKNTFKNALISSIKANNYKIETEMVFRTFNLEIAKQFPMYNPPAINYHEVLQFKESFPSFRKKELIPNTAQHNIPAWTIFAMFFIVIPLTQSLIKEREEGSLFRLLPMPVSYMNLIMAKVMVYIVVCMLQTLFMLIAGILILPLFGIPRLDLGNDFIGLTLMSLVVSMASVGYGLMIGTIAKTHQQAAAFGSISVIILAAMGGLWVPIYLMPSFMRTFSQYSPMNWAITGYYNIFLRGGSLINILPEMLRLLLFFLGTVLVTGIYRRFKSPLPT